MLLDCLWVGLDSNKSLDVHSSLVLFHTVLINQNIQQHLMWHHIRICHWYSVLLGSCCYIHMHFLLYFQPTVGAAGLLELVTFCALDAPWVCSSFSTALDGVTISISCAGLPRAFIILHRDLLGNICIAFNNSLSISHWHVVLACKICRHHELLWK